MNFKTTIGLIVVLAVVVVALFFTRSAPRPAEAPPEQIASSEGAKYIDLTAGQVKQLTIVDADGNRTTLQRSGDTWRLTEPVDAPAVDWSAKDLIGQIVELRTHGQPSSTPSDDGLAKPRYRIEITSDDGKTQTLELGNSAGAGDLLYAKLDGGDVNLVPATIEKPLKTAAEDVRDKHLASNIQELDVKQVWLDYGDTHLTLAQRDGKWTVSQPPPSGMRPATNFFLEAPGDESAISSLISSVVNLEASSFVPADSDEAAFARFNHPTLRVRLSTESPATSPSEAATQLGGLTLTVGAPDSLARTNYFVQTSGGQIAKIAASSLDPLRKTAIDLRDKNVLSIVPADIDRITIVRQTFPAVSTQPSTEPIMRPQFVRAQRLVLQRRPIAPAPMGPSLPSTRSSRPTSRPAPQPVWMNVNDPKAMVDEAKVQALLAKFTPLTADQFVSSPWRHPLERYEIELLPRAPVGKPPQAMHILVVKPNDGTHAWAEYDDLTFQPPDSLVDALEAMFSPGSGTGAFATPVKPPQLISARRLPGPPD